LGSGLGKAFSSMLGGSAPASSKPAARPSVYNRKLAFELKQARETARGAAIGGAQRREQAVFSKSRPISMPSAARGGDGAAADPAAEAGRDHPRE
jgi:hypothetical protein